MNYYAMIKERQRLTSSHKLGILLESKSRETEGIDYSAAEIGSSAKNRSGIKDSIHSNTIPNTRRNEEVSGI